MRKLLLLATLSRRTPRHATEREKLVLSARVALLRRIVVVFFVCVLSVGDRVWWWCLCRERGRIGVFFFPQSVQDTRAERRYLDMATFHTIVPSFRNN